MATAGAVLVSAGRSSPIMPTMSDPVADTEAEAANPRLLRAVDHAIADLRRGEMVVLVHDGASIVLEAAETLTSEGLSRLARLTGRQLVLALTQRRAALLGRAPAPSGPGGSVLIPIPEGSEVEFLRDLADPSAAPTAPSELDRVHLPQAVADAAIELTKLARLLPAAMLGRITGPVAATLAADGIHTVHAAAIMDYQRAAAQSLRPVAEAKVPLELAEDARIIAFRPGDGGMGHIAIVIGAIDPAQPVLVRLHSECFTGDILGSLRCDCGAQLRGAIAAIARAGSGILLYLAQEGRGIGLVNKLRAYNLQDAGFDTFDANEQLGFDDDERVYLPAAAMLQQLGATRVRLMTNNPDKVAALDRCGITVVERVPHVFPANAHNERYLRAKATRHGHHL
jgi:GTP cyclohydrolase II